MTLLGPQISQLVGFTIEFDNRVTRYGYALAKTT